MSTARILVAMILAFVLSSGLGYLIHGVLLGHDYEQVMSLFRPAAATIYYLIFLANAAYAIAFVWIYAKGVEDAPAIMQGLRFGFLAWLLAKLPAFTIQYAISPLPSMLLVKQLAYELVCALIIGIVTALIVRKN